MISGPQHGRDGQNPTPDSQTDPGSASENPLEKSLIGGVRTPDSKKIAGISRCPFLTEVKTKAEHWPGAPEGWEPGPDQCLFVANGLLMAKFLDYERESSDPNILKRREQVLDMFELAFNNLRIHERNEILSDISEVKTLSWSALEKAGNISNVPAAQNDLSEVLTSAWFVNRLFSDAVKRPELFHALVDRMSAILETQKCTEDINGIKSFHFSPTTLGQVVYGLTQADYQSDKLEVRPKRAIKAEIRRALTMCGLEERVAENIVRDHNNSTEVSGRGFFAKVASWFSA